MMKADKRQQSGVDDQGPSRLRLTLIACAAPPASLSERFSADPEADPNALHRLARQRERLTAFRSIWSSPGRAAIASAAALGVDPHVEEALRDREIGHWADRSLAEVAASEPDGFAAWLGDPAASAPEGESALQVLDRVRPWLEQRTREDGSMLAITHPAVIRACVVHALDGAPAAWTRIDIGYGTRTILTQAGSLWRLALLNAT